jgi:small subunit ribosomal protein S16
LAVKIRLRRVGAKKQPAYRVVVADSRSPRDGRNVEVIGHYNPLSEPSTVVINAERALYWLGKGAQPSDVVKKFLTKLGIWAAFTGEAPPAPVVVETPAPVAVEAPIVVEEVAAPAEEPVVEEAPAEAPVVAEEAAVEAPVAEVAVVDEPVVAEEAAPEAPAAEAVETPEEK